MKNLSFLLLLASLIGSSCTKTGDLVSVTHTIRYWKDVVPFANSAYECPGDQTWVADTVLYFNHGMPTGSLVTHTPVVVKMDSVDGGWSRQYFEFLN